MFIVCYLADHRCECVCGLCAVVFLDFVFCSYFSDYIFGFFLFFFTTIDGDPDSKHLRSGDGNPVLINPLLCRSLSPRPIPSLFPAASPFLPLCVCGYVFMFFRVSLVLSLDIFFVVVTLFSVRCLCITSEREKESEER